MITSIEKDQLMTRVDKALDDIRPHLEVDGGNIELVDILDDMTVLVKWVGNCVNCSMSLMTMKAGVEQVVKAQVPEVIRIQAVNGENLS